MRLRLRGRPEYERERERERETEREGERRENSEGERERGLESTWIAAARLMTDELCFGLRSGVRIQLLYPR